MFPNFPFSRFLQIKFFCEKKPGLGIFCRNVDYSFLPLVVFASAVRDQTKQNIFAPWPNPTNRSQACNTSLFVFTSVIKIYWAQACQLKYFVLTSEGKYEWIEFHYTRDYKWLLEDLYLPQRLLYSHRERMHYMYALTNVNYSIPIILNLFEIASNFLAFTIPILGGVQNGPCVNSTTSLVFTILQCKLVNR